MIPIKDRCYSFSLAVIKFLKSSDWDILNGVLLNQLLRSATSIGANVTEAQGSSSRAEFKRYYEIALRSANESLYWLNLIRDSNALNEHKHLRALIIECTEISKMLGAAVTKLKGKS